MKYSNIIIICLILTSVESDVNLTHGDITFLIKGAQVWVIENYKLPYKTHIRHIFLPPPNSTVENAIQTDSSIFLYADNYEWQYDRFKLRNVLYNHSHTNKWSPIFVVSLLFIKSKICRYLLRL